MSPKTEPEVETPASARSQTNAETPAEPAGGGASSERDVAAAGDEGVPAFKDPSAAPAGAPAGPPPAAGAADAAGGRPPPDAVEPNDSGDGAPAGVGEACAAGDDLPEPGAEPGASERTPPDGGAEAEADSDTDTDTGASTPPASSTEAEPATSEREAPSVAVAPETGPASSPAAEAVSGAAPPDAPAPAALAVDDAGEHLGRAALHLIRAGIDVFYAKDADEALLLSRQEADRIGVVVAPVSRGVAELGGLLDALGRRRAGGRPPVVLVGEPDTEESREALRDAGAAWVLPEPYHESAFVWVVARALEWPAGEETLGKDWAPASLLASVLAGTQRHDLVVCGISPAGALLDTGAPFEPDAAVVLELALPDGLLTLKGVVQADAGGLGDGVAVRFTAVPPATAERLGGLAAAQAEGLRA